MFTTKKSSTDRQFLFVLDFRETSGLFAMQQVICYVKLAKSTAKCVCFMEWEIPEILDPNRNY